jgi:hypothetical protein
MDWGVESSGKGMRNCTYGSQLAFPLVLIIVNNQTTGIIELMTCCSTIAVDRESGTNFQCLQSKLDIRLGSRGAGTRILDI